LAPVARLRPHQRRGFSTFNHKALLDWAHGTLVAGQPPPHAERGSSYFAHLAAGMMGHVRAWEAAWEVRQSWGDEAAAREATAREEQAEGAGTEGAEASGGGGYAFVLEDDAVRTPHFGRPLPCWLKVFATL
jgi:hypothetical protein